MTINLTFTWLELAVWIAGWIVGMFIYGFAKAAVLDWRATRRRRGLPGRPPPTWQMDLDAGGWVSVNIREDGGICLEVATPNAGDDGVNLSRAEARVLAGLVKPQ